MIAQREIFVEKAIAPQIPVKQKRTVHLSHRNMRFVEKIYATTLILDVFLISIVLKVKNGRLG